MLTIGVALARAPARAIMEATEVFIVNVEVDVNETCLTVGDEKANGVKERMCCECG